MKRKLIGAFTLVDLLVVIGIIALLISVLLPALNKARKSAIRVQCSSTLRQFAIADQLYMNSHRDWHLPAFWGDDYLYNRTWPGYYEFRRALAMPISTDGNQRCYVDKKWYCPEAMRGLTFTYDPTTNSMVVPMNYSYGMNVECIDEDKYAASNPQQCDVVNFPQIKQPHAGAGDVIGINSIHAFRRSQVRRPAEKLFIVDAMWIIVNEPGSGPNPGWLGQV